MKKTLTQKTASLYMLVKQYERDPLKLIPAWQFMGELYVPEVDEHFFMSYKCPANGIGALYLANTRAIHREYVTGKSGSKFYQYKLVDPFDPKLLDEESMRDFYYKVADLSHLKIDRI